MSPCAGRYSNSIECNLARQPFDIDGNFVMKIKVVLALHTLENYIACCVGGAQYILQLFISLREVN